VDRKGGGWHIECMGKKKKQKNPPTETQLLDAIKKKYFDSEPPTCDKQKTAVKFLHSTYIYNINKNKND
jgi:hypothetical protein